MRNSVDVHNYLVERDVRHELLTVRGRFRTPERLAAVLELPPAQVGKIVVYETDDEATAVAGLVPSDTDPDPQRVERAVGLPGLRPVTAARASELSDYIPEAIPPVGLPERFRVVMDRALADQEVVYFSAGDPAAVLKLRGDDLARATDAVVADLV
jgi:prolyl-tRNA editing enzyme YbaK/EbsC (Cys-tRNA(Pro) deacylase)